MGFSLRVRRVAPLGAGERSPQVERLLAVTGAPGLPAANVFATLARNEELFRAWLPFCGQLLSGRLPARDRELVILRVALLCDAGYEWAQHAVLARRAGLSDAEIDRVRNGADADGWTADDVVLLRAADELHEANCLSDATWDALTERWDEPTLVELVMLIGQYHMVAYALNTFGVQIESSGTEASL